MVWAFQSFDMSIKSAGGHVPKRRKLSHYSESGTKLPDGVRGDTESMSQLANIEGVPEQATRTAQTFGQSRKDTSAMITGGMTKSSIMQFQANELLAEVKSGYENFSRKPKTLLDKLVQIIKAIPARSSLSFPAAEKNLRKKSSIAIPFGVHRPASDIKYKFEYQPPEQVRIRNVLAQSLANGNHGNWEVAIQMPSTLFQEKDYLNYRALHKRAYYTACVADGIWEAFGNDFDCRYSFQDENELAPIILIQSNPKAHSPSLPEGMKIFIIVGFPSSIGSVEKMLPTRNCVRTASSGQSNNANSVNATPFYNNTIRLLATFTEIDQVLDQVAQKCDSFSDTCILGQIWLRQRGFASTMSERGFGLAEWAHMCALLLTSGGHKGHALFSERYSSIQLFKAMLQVLANRDLTDPLVISAQSLDLEKGQMPILFDGSNGVNVLGKMSRWSYDLLRRQAQISLTAVNARVQDNFEPTFILKVAEPNLHYDEIYTIDLTERPFNFSESLYDTLKKGLGDRVSSLDLKQPSEAVWNLDSPAPKQSRNQKPLEIRLMVNPEAALRLIDHGPTVEEQEEALAFREFWGQKSELRRFRDGSITETLVWTSEKSVIWQIIEYLAASHFEIAPTSIGCKTPSLHRTYLPPTSSINAEDAFKLINDKFQDLSSKLHQMEGLPLPIRSVSPVGPALRSSAAGHPLGNYTSAPIDILVQFDSSSRWPDHLLAIQHTKIAFLAKLSDLLRALDSSYTTRIGLENVNASSASYYNTSFLDIVLPSPMPGLSAILFRLRIHHERELQLLQNLLAGKSVPDTNRDNASSALLEHKRVFIASPLHTTSIRNLVTHFQPLSSTIRLLKSWIASHNLSNHIPDQVLDVITANVYLHPYPWSIPGSVTTAFLRCLHFLSRWDWAASPLIVDLSLSQDMTSAQNMNLETRFQAWRKLDPNMNTVAWFVGTSIDNTGTIWTQGARPARVVAGRVTALAKAAMDLVKTKGTNMHDDDWTTLFTSPISDFDFVIYLKPSVLRGGLKRHRENGHVKFKNLQVQEDLDVVSIGHDAVSLYLEDLEGAFGNVALFFHGDGRDRIAGLWRPSVTGRKDWRVRIGYSTVPYAGQRQADSDLAKETAVINTEGILAEIALLGEGMIEKIDVR